MDRTYRIRNIILSGEIHSISSSSSGISMFKFAFRVLLLLNMDGQDIHD